MKKRIGLFLLCLTLILTTVLSGCSKDDGKVKLIVDLHGWMPTLSKTGANAYQAPQEIADAFMKQYDNITIEWARGKTLGNAADMSQYFTTQINRGNCPAIAFSWGTYFQDRDWYLPLDSYLSTNNEFETGTPVWKDTFRDYLWQHNWIVNAKNEIVAIPLVLNVASPTGYFYNETIFTDSGVTGAPQTWKELLDDLDAVKTQYPSGVTPLAPSGLSMKKDFNSWIMQFNLGPSFAKYVMSLGGDYDSNGALSVVEQLRGVKAGLYNPETKTYAADLMREMKNYYGNVLEAGWDTTTTYEASWTQGNVAVKESGLWSIGDENQNHLRNFDFGVFPAPLISNDSYNYLLPLEYTDPAVDEGPETNAPDLVVNIMKPAVKNNPELLDAAVKFLKFMTTKTNDQKLVTKKDSGLGSVKGTTYSPTVLNSGFLDQPFPKMSNITWPVAFTADKNDALSREFENWIAGDLTDAAFFKKVNDLQQAGADEFIAAMKISKTGW